MRDYEAGVNAHSRSMFCVAEGFGRSPTRNKGSFSGLCSLLATMNERIVVGYTGEIALNGVTGKMKR